MPALKLSELAIMLNEHLEKHGDANVAIFEERGNWYKILSKNDIQVGPDNNFVFVSEDLGDIDDY